MFTRPVVHVRRMFSVEEPKKNANQNAIRISLRIFIPESQFLEQTLQAVLVGAPSEDGPQIAFVNVLDFLLHHHGNNPNIRSTKEQREREGNYPEKVIATVAANLLNSGSQMIKHLKCRKRRT